MLQITSYKNKGFTFIQTLVGLFILLLVFIGLYGTIQATIKIASKSKAQITAASLANQKIESIRNLSYQKIGTQGGIPTGEIPETSTTTINNITYITETDIGYVDDDFDGLAPSDSNPNDYKRIRIEVSWPGFLSKKIVSITDITPPGLESEIGGGNLSIAVFNANGIPVPQAQIHLVNQKTDPIIDTTYQTNDEGKYLIAGAPTSTNSYEITISKDGYSMSKTYSTSTVATPEKPHATVLEGQLTPISFSIDKLGSFSIDTLSPWGSGLFTDSFNDQSKISQISNTQINDGELILATTTATTTEYKSAGYAFSESIQPSNLVDWKELNWSENEPANTQINCQLYYATSSSWNVIPDSSLSGNSVGFTSSPINLEGLSTSTYSNLKIKANLNTNKPTSTPSLGDWRLSWKTNIPTPISNVDFNLQGQKTIGTDESGDPVYKYSQNLTTNSNGHIDIYDMEWDLYDFTIASGLDIVKTIPSSDPLGKNISLNPNENKSIELYLEAENSLLITVQNTDTADFVFDAQVRVYNASLGYDQIQHTNEQGQTLFSPLETATYNIEVQKDGYENYSGSINVSGDETKTINLAPSDPS